MSPVMTMSSQAIHKPLSSSTIDTTLAPSGPSPTPATPATPENCVAGKKHTSTPPPPPIPARSSRRPVSAVLTSGRKLFKCPGDDQPSTESSGKDRSPTRESLGRNMAGLQEDRLRPCATGETSQTREGNGQPRPQRKQRKSRASAATVVEDIDREASNVCEIIEDRLYFMWTLVYPISTRRTTYLTVDKYLRYQPFFADFGPFDIANVFQFCCLMKERLELAQRQNKVLCLYTQPEDDKRANTAFALCCYMMLLHDKTPEEAYAHVEFIYPAIKPYRDAGCGPSTFSLTILDCLRGLRKGLDRGLLRLDQFDVKEYEYYENPRNGDFNWITPSFIAFAAPQDTLTYSDLLKRQAEVLLQRGGSVADSGVDASIASESMAGSSSESSSRSPTPSSLHSSNDISRRSTPSIQSMECVPEMEYGRDTSSAVTGPILELSVADTQTSAETTSLSHHDNPDDSDFSESKSPASSNDDAHSRAESKTSKSSAKRTPTRLTKSFRNILDYFATHNVQSVIRLNDKTYDEAHFRARGIEHHDLQYPDGTCPPWDIVDTFLDLCKDTIEHKHGVVAVHCMAGLGRTGTLIGVYLMRQYGMTARETIAFLRLMRPGSVVGPQQNWLVANEQRIRQTSWESRQEQLHLQHPLLQRMHPHLASGQKATDSSPQSSKTQSPAVSMIATPATDYEQVFSRANSEGLESTWFGVKAEVDDEAMEVLEDDEESSPSSSTEETATGDESSLASTASTVQDDRMDEDSISATERDVTLVHGPVPLTCQRGRQVSFSSLESLSTAIEKGSRLSDGSDHETTTLQGGVASEHIGSQNYVIPVQPRKAQPQQQQQQHEHHRQGRREGSLHGSPSATTSPKLSMASTLETSNNATLDKGPCQVLKAARHDETLSSKVDAHCPGNEPFTSDRKHNPASPSSLNDSISPDDLSLTGLLSTQQGGQDAGSLWLNSKTPVVSNGRQ
ncbi:unnamed protein product [Mortierella alpina]